MPQEDFSHIRGSAKRPRRQLTEDQAREILLRLRAGEIAYRLAKEYDVHRTTILNLKNGHNWKHLHAEINAPILDTSND